MTAVGGVTEELVERIHEFVRDGTGVCHVLIEELSATDFDEAPGKQGPSWVKREQLAEGLTVEYRRAT